MSGAGDPEVTTRDGRRLHAERHGHGSPTVVFEAGMGFSRSSWGAVIPLVAELTSVVAYDRSGLGRSPRDPAPRDLARLAADLVDVLGALGTGPFVLVGHSWGGPIVRSAAAMAPDRVAGLVLVDQTDEGCDLFFSRAQAVQTAISGPLMRVMARTGLLRRLLRRQVASVPEPWRTGLLTEDGTPAAVAAQLAELRSCTDDLRRLRAEPLALPDVPVTYISGGKTGFGERGRRGELVAAHRAAAAALPQGRHVLAEASSHYVPITEPEVIAAEIRRIVEAARGA